MIARILGYLLATALSVPAAASQVYEKPPTALDPGKAYVVVETGKVDDGLLYGTLVLGRYDSAAQDIVAPTMRPPDGKIPRGGWKLDNRLHLIKPAMKVKERRLYIAELDPGLWVVEGANDTAFSLGSSTLQLEAGTVIDLGVATIYSDFPEGEKRDVLTSGRLMKGAIMGGLLGSRLPPPMPKAVEFRPRGAADMPLPLGLAEGAQPVTWAGAVRFGNHLNGLVNRMGGRKARPHAQAVLQAAEPEPKEQPATPGAVDPEPLMASAPAN